MVEVTIEERDAKAVYFSLDDYDDAKLLAEAAKFLEGLKGHGDIWMLLGMNRQSDEFGNHLTLFLERKPTIMPRPSPPTDATQARPPPYTAPKEPEIRYL